MQNRDGRVTKRDFRRVLESFCFRMSQQQFHELMAKIDPYNKGYVSYLEFLDRFEQRETKVIHVYSAVVFRNTRQSSSIERNIFTYTTTLKVNFVNPTP